MANNPVLNDTTWTLDRPGNLWRARGRTPIPAGYTNPIVSSRMHWGQLTAAVTPVAPPSGNDTFILGTTKPDATNTGQAGYTAIYGASAAARTTVNGDVTLSTPGQVYENKHVVGYIYVRAANVTIRNCGVTNRSTNFVTSGLIDTASSAAQNCVIEFCDIYQTPNTAMFWLNGIKQAGGSTVMARRNNIRDVADCINCGDANGGVMRTQGNYLHHRAFFNNSTDHPNDPERVGWEHNDTIQISAGSGHYFDGDYHEGNLSSTVGTIAALDQALAIGWGNCITVSPDKGLVTNSTITRSWFEYGYRSCVTIGRDPVSNRAFDFGVVSYNRFGMGQYDYGNNSRYQIRWLTNATIGDPNNSANPIFTNYFDPDAPTVPTNKKGVLFTVGFTGGIRIN